jgi:hypothetical protein
MRSYLLYPNRSMRVPEIRAAFLKSFGFGQAGAECVLVHPNYVLAALEDDAAYDAYRSRRDRRERKTYRYMQGVFSGKHGFVQVKTRAPYTPEQEQNVYVLPLPCSLATVVVADVVRTLLALVQPLCCSALVT